MTTPGSKHCRTELHENNSWDPNGAANRLSAMLMATQIDGSGSTCIGQVHIDESLGTSKPVAELFYNANGLLEMGVERTREGGNEVLTPVGNVPVGQTFSYQIKYEKNVLSVSINNGSPTLLSTYDLGAPLSYFKLGNYNQGDGLSESPLLQHRRQPRRQQSVAAFLRPSMPPASTISKPGLGPIDIISYLGHPVTAPPSTTTTTTPPPCRHLQCPSHRGQATPSTCSFTAPARAAARAASNFQYWQMDSCHTAESGLPRLRPGSWPNVCSARVSIFKSIRARAAAGASAPTI